MNFYFLCLVALITIISVKDVLYLSNKVVLIICALVLIGMVLYRTNVEMFSLSLIARKDIFDSIKESKKQRKDAIKIRKNIADTLKRIKMFN
jgi:hypothetical protein